jgi:hypothetical protein
MVDKKKAPDGPGLDDSKGVCAFPILNTTCPGAGYASVYRYSYGIGRAASLQI